MISSFFTILRQRKLEHFGERASLESSNKHARSSAFTQVFLPTTSPSCNCNTDTARLRRNHRRGRCGNGRAQAAADRAAPWPSPAALSASLPSLGGQPAGDAPLTASQADPAPPAAAFGLRAQAPGQPARAHALVGARARARRPQQQHQRDNARASGARAGSVGSGLSHVGQSDVGHSPHPHPHTRTLLPACMYNKYVLPHLLTPTHETRV